MSKRYEMTAQGMKRFLGDLKSLYLDEDAKEFVRFDPPIIVTSEDDEQEGVVRTCWHMFPEGEPVYGLEIDPERERALLAFRSHIPLDAPLFRAELLDALNAVNFLMEPAHFVLDDHDSTPILRFLYAIPVEETHISYEHLLRMMLDTMLWVSSLAPELKAVAQGQLAADTFIHWLYEHSDRLFEGARDERIRWWLEHRHKPLT